MKRKYQKPTSKIIFVGSENMIAGSDNRFQLNINSDAEINQESNIWSNQESNHDIW